MDITAQCSGENGLSHDIRIAAFGTCSACGGNQVLPTAAIPASLGHTAQTSQPVRIPDAIERMGPNTCAVTYGRHDDELTSYRVLDGPGWGF